MGEVGVFRASAILAPVPLVGCHGIMWGRAKIRDSLVCASKIDTTFLANQKGMPRAFTLSTKAELLSTTTPFCTAHNKGSCRILWTDDRLFENFISIMNLYGCVFYQFRGINKLAGWLVIFL